MRVYAANKIKKKIKKRCCLHNITGRAHRCASSHPHVPFFFFDQPASPPDAFIETLEQHIIYQTRDSNYGKKRGELISTCDGRLKSLITALCTHLINPCRQLAPNRRRAHEIESKIYRSREEEETRYSRDGEPLQMLPVNVQYTSRNKAHDRRPSPSTNRSHICGPKF